MTRITNIMEGYRIMTSSECISKLEGMPRNANRLGTLYTWVKQGVVQSKTFRKVIEHMLDTEARRAEFRASKIVEEESCESIA